LIRAPHRFPSSAASHWALGFLLPFCLLARQTLTATVPLKALIIDGQNNHKWEETTPILKRILEETGLFVVEVATAPPKGADLSRFMPRFGAYAVVLSNYNGDPWSKACQAAFEHYVRGGGGFVVIHAADNSFPEWKAYNEMIAIGGWGNRTPDAGPYVRFRDGKVILEQKAGPTGNHGKAHAFQVIVRDRAHPITRGLPVAWMHAADELYDSLRGPAEHMTLLATAFSDPKTGGSAENEPVLLTVAYGKGRVFHTVLGDNVGSLSCVGFIVTLQRGTEWAATGKVTQHVPADFPTADRVMTRP
jgi:uncharacterized protein